MLQLGERKDISWSETSQHAKLKMHFARNWRVCLRGLLICYTFTGVKLFGKKNDLSFTNAGSTVKQKW